MPGHVGNGESTSERGRAVPAVLRLRAAAHHDDASAKVCHARIPSARESTALPPPGVEILLGTRAGGLAWGGRRKHGTTRGGAMLAVSMRGRSAQIAVQGQLTTVGEWRGFNGFLPRRCHSVSAIAAPQRCELQAVQGFG